MLEHCTGILHDGGLCGVRGHLFPCSRIICLHSGPRKEDWMWCILLPPIQPLPGPICPHLSPPSPMPLSFFPAFPFCLHTGLISTVHSAPCVGAHRLVQAFTPVPATGIAAAGATHALLVQRLARMVPRVSGQRSGSFWRSPELV